MTNRWVSGSCLDVIPTLVDDVQLVVADPPYDDVELINESISLCRSRCRGPSFFFMYAETLCDLEHRPDQVLFWVKPVSTKNTRRRYSRFVETIAVFDLADGPFNQEPHWYTRSGTFTDTLTQSGHPHQKPHGLIEKLVLVNSNSGDTVLDPFAGSGTVHRVCQTCGRSSVSIEVDPEIGAPGV